MGATAIAVPYVVFVWWFSTGAVLSLVGLAARYPTVFKCGTAVAFLISALGIVVSSRMTDDASAYCAFTCAIFIWGTVEMSLLAGWITGPRPEPCPQDCTPSGRLGYALQAIAYHELALMATGGLVFAVTVYAPNRLSWWTFAALLILRQSAKINLFLGVRTLNDELLPQQVRFMRSYFSQKSINVLFPFSVVGAVAATVLIAYGAVTASSPFEGIALSLLASLVALGAIEHGFMVLPMPVVNLWRWSTHIVPAPVLIAPTPALMAPAPALITPKPAIQAAALPTPTIARPMLAVIPGGAPPAERPVSAAKSAAAAARQRLEEQFRQAYRQARTETSPQPVSGLAAAGTAAVDPNTSAQGGVS